MGEIVGLFSFFVQLHKSLNFLLFLSFSCNPRNGKCKKIEEGQECLQGMRLRQYHMLCGALLRVWKRVSDVVSDLTSSSILQIVRLKTKHHNKQVGQYNPPPSFSSQMQRAYFTVKNTAGNVFKTNEPDVSCFDDKNAMLSLETK